MMFGGEFRAILALQCRPGQTAIESARDQAFDVAGKSFPVKGRCVPMHHYVAFLRGINLGNRRLKMDELRRLFEQLKFTDVATFIASGNVLFASKSADRQKLAQTIAAHLHKSLDYPVDTFLPHARRGGGDRRVQPVCEGRHGKRSAHPARRFSP